MTKTSIKEYKPEYIAEYSINNQMRQVRLPVDNKEDMKTLRKLIRQEKIDLELDDQIIKGSRLVRFFEQVATNDFDYLLGRIADDHIRERFVLIRKQRRSEGKIASIKILWSIYQTDYLGVKKDQIVECDDIDTIVKLLEPTYRL